jgi:hypothetical protein
MLDSFNKFSKVLIDEFLNAFLLYRKVDHKIKVMSGSAPPSKVPHRLNQKELERIKKKLITSLVEGIFDIGS